MKILIRCAGLFLCAAPFAHGATSHPYRPAQVVLTTGIQMPVVTGGQNHGSMTLPARTVVNVKSVRKTKLKIDFAGNQQWIARAWTDYDQRRAPLRVAQQKQALLQKQQMEAKTAAFEQQKQAAVEKQQAQLQDWSSPLERGPYDSHRSTVDRYDWLGRRYHYGVFGQRIYQ
ncbi:MAG TPA: hypothetical protein VGO11_18035 [Chthoniobacteraceae bacterium]|jgi:hypothetical protein|nr:hypothetical protein [Chthoniobacteraceae bacterium]